METNFFDMIILGSGPAGLSAAQYAARAALKVLVIENGASSQAFNINKLENYPGLYPAVSGPDFMDAMKSQAVSFGANFRIASINSIDKIGETFTLKTDSETFKSNTVLIATGAEHRKLGIPGETELEGRGVSYCATCDGPFFRNKRIIVIGGGDAACDEATYLSTLSKDVTIIHRKSSFRAQKAVADRILTNDSIKKVFNTVVKEIKGSEKVEAVVVENMMTGETSEIGADGVFIFVGMIPRSDLVDMLPKDDGGYIITNEKMETPVKGLYCAGDIRSKSFRQVVTATADGAIAADSAGKYIRELKGEIYK
ncbi:MAG: thioredoxin-disulfide reductase [Treponemataceae bacterium]|nr:thioredoxin-disulfide reductase [Treponemataceae bacterium]